MKRLGGQCMSRYYSMGVLIVIVVFYLLGALDITEELSYSLSLAALIFSISMVFDTYAKGNKKEIAFKNILEALALGVAIILPNMKNNNVVRWCIDNLDNNYILILTIFFTLAAQISCEIKIKDIENYKDRKSKDK